MQALVAAAFGSGAETIGDVSLHGAALAIRNLVLLLIVQQLILKRVQPIAHLAVSEQLKLSFFIALNVTWVRIRLYCIVSRALRRRVGVVFILIEFASFVILMVERQWAKQAQVVVLFLEDVVNLLKRLLALRVAQDISSLEKYGCILLEFNRNGGELPSAHKFCHEIVHVGKQGFENFCLLIPLYCLKNLCLQLLPGRHLTLKSLALAVELRSRSIMCHDHGRSVLLAHLEDGLHKGARVRKVKHEHLLRHSLVLAAVAAAQVLVFLASWPLLLWLITLLELRDVRQGQADRVKILI